MKVLRGNKIKGGLRRVYVSWHLTRQQALEWKEEFWLRLTTDTGQMSHSFDDCLQSGDAHSGSLLQAWFDSKLAAGSDNPVTDVVAVLSNEYIAANTDRRPGPGGEEMLASGELARFFDHMMAHADSPLRIYLAPVDKPRWEHYAVRRVRLQDAGATHRWLMRLRDERFTWPYEGPAKCSDEVADAVAMITG